MDKVIKFIKKYWIVIFVVAAIILYVTNLLIKKPTPPPTQNTQAQQGASYKNITPGVSSEADLIKALGNPIKTTTVGAQKTDEYNSTSPTRRHTITIQNGNVVLIKEIVSSNDTTTSSSITTVYGTAPDILYSHVPDDPFKLYVYPANGIAYLGHSDGTLLEIWYFKPTTIEDFVNLWGQDYQITQPAPQMGY